MAVARRFTIRGRVQGVFFRESTRRVAESLGITGHAINLANGDVEVLACGEPAALDKLAEYLADGPTMAVVTGVSSEVVDIAESGEFDRFVTG
ncbi:MAG: acylphosphatase [Woeseiaceae bacterium]|nr:acylphosphatase [Woeseiaceae bacterium]